MGDRPERERIVADVETLKALSDTLRLKILARMVTREDEPWTVKELAAALGVSPTRLYHHIDILLERDLIRPAGQRVVSGIIETSYRVTALELRLDKALFASELPAALRGASKVLMAHFDAARQELEAALRSAASSADHDMKPDRPLAAHLVARLTREHAAEVRTRLHALVDELEGARDAADGPSGSDDTDAYGVVVAMYHLADKRRSKR
jgi:DNA-binding transcriptional ArsR family regulator